MPDWLQQLIVPLASAAGGGLLTALAVMWRYGRALLKGMQALMRGELHRIHRETVKKGLPVDIDVAEEADDIYDAYHALGGNGVGTKLHREIIEAHYGPDSKET
ncbi:hypothetical protein PT279_08985 [Bifidobacterium sp. ESL0784]|uniref:hypothetical protein n=1 Tax=Bifidobacterium sp. ESL0784 TaxID=2983231 RepID=UPI0023F716DF|nr:hypothetical protein [Bifidobacterium sp. ESL0784]MDF7641716.1 hypothetical protein [Bifidobacterium sp. ESL0784]